MGRLIKSGESLTDEEMDYIKEIQMRKTDTELRLEALKATAAVTLPTIGGATGSLLTQAERIWKWLDTGVNPLEPRVIKEDSALQTGR